MKLLNNCRKAFDARDILYTNMNKEQLQEYFKTHRNSIKIGASELAKRTHSSIKDVYAAKEEFRKSSPSNSSKKNPKILIFDIETAPVKAFVWKMWKENISLDQIINDWFVICWSAKWLGSTNIMGECLTPKEIKKEDDKRVVKALWKLFDEADIIIAHNASRFDIPKMNARFLYHNLVPPTPYRVIDTLEVAKKQFKFTSNKLDALADFFGFPRKLNTDFNLWKDCLDGKESALKYMFKYNKYDVELLEAVYLKLLPWIHNHPNLSNYLDTNNTVCSNCGSSHMELIKNSYYKTQVGTFQLYRCKDCGAISRGRLSITPKPKTVSLAR